MKKTHQVGWDFLVDYGSFEWQHTLHDLEEAPNVAYEDVLRDLIRFGVSKVSLLLIAILWLLERLGPRWALFLESPRLVVFLRDV